MKTQYYTASSLDGFIATEDHSLDWLFQFGDTGSSGFEYFLKGVGAIVMGSQTYEWILRNHVQPDTDDKQPWPYEQPSWVFTTRCIIQPPLTLISARTFGNAFVELKYRVTKTSTA